jgi:hypothetical protein
MKKSLLFIGATVLSANIFSQDQINAADGSIIIAKVLEVNTTDIKYQKSSDPNGQTYVMNKSEILSIHYKNGTNDFFSSKTISEANIGEENTQIATTEQTKVVNGYNTAAEPVASADPSFDQHPQPAVSNSNDQAIIKKQQRRDARNEFFLNLALVSAQILINTNCGGGIRTGGHIHCSNHRTYSNRCR